MIEIKEIQTPQDKLIAFEIRKKVFVDEQNVPLEEEYDEFEDSSRHFLAFFNGVPSGTARMRVTSKGIKLERFAVLKEYRRRNVGLNLVKNLLTKCNDRIKSRVYLYAQVSARPFYEKLSFGAKGEIFMEAGIEHIEMDYKENN